LTSLEVIDLHDNNLKGSIPRQIGNLSNLSSFIVSYNEITGVIPDEFAHLSKLKLFHVHGNRLSGTVPNLSMEGQNKSSFIADCGSPSVFDIPLDCPSCTMCCNSNQGCDVKESKTDFGIWSLLYVGSLVIALILASTSVIKKLCSFICNIGQNVPSNANEYYTIGKDSAYCFFLSDRITAWVLAIGVLATQALCFGFFIDEASLNFESDRIWSYTYICSRNNLICRNNSDVTAFGWIVFTLFALVYLVCDMLNGLKIVWGVSEHGLSRKGFQTFIGGCSLFVITALALYATVVYNVSASRSNLEMIFNTVILLFVNDLDEKLYASLRVVSPEWLEKTTTEIAASFNGNVRINIQYASTNQQLIDQQTRIQNIENKLVMKSEAIQDVKTKNEELDRKVQELESFKEQQKRKVDDIERNRDEIDAKNKKLEEKVTGLEKDNENLKAKNQELDKKMEGLESELKNLEAKIQKFLERVEH